MCKQVLSLRRKACFLGLCSKKNVADFHITGFFLIEKPACNDSIPTTRIHQNNTSKYDRVTFFFPPVGLAAFHSTDTLFSMTRPNTKLRILAEMKPHTQSYNHTSSSSQDKLPRLNQGTSTLHCMVVGTHWLSTSVEGRKTDKSSYNNLTFSGEWLK